MKHKNIPVIAIFILLFLLFSQVNVPYFPFLPVYSMEKNIPFQLSNAYLNRYIVVLKQPKINGNGKSFIHQKQVISKQHLSLWKQWNQKADNIRMVGELFAVSNAIILSADSTNCLGRIRNHPDVKGIYCVNEYYLQRNISVPSIMAPEVWKKTDAFGIPVMGNRIKIGVIDSGIEYWHGDLGGGIGKKPDGSFYKVMSGYDFAEMNAIPYDSGISFHGTHVAGIIAGYGEAGIASGDSIGKGVAPQANLISYKVFTSQNKSTGSDAVLLALDQAVLDGCDVINLSLGRFFGWSDDFLSIACQNVSEKGIIVVASAGNDGEKDSQYNIFPINAPSSGKDIISVASIDETIKTGFTFTFNGEFYQYPGKLFQNSPSFSQEPTPVCFFTGEGKEEEYQNKDVTGKIVCLRRGGISFAEKNAIAKKFGANGILIYNFTKGWFNGFMQKSETNLPMMSISQEAGNALQKILQGTTDLSIQFVSSMQCTVISDFSSEGPTPDDIFKPDISAPGTNILSSSLMGSYAYASGTSMSAPHVSGAAALLKQAFPNYTNREIRSLLLNYADVVVNPYTHVPYSWLRQGAGKLNVLRSYEGPATIFPPTLVLPEPDFNDQVASLEVSFQCSNQKEEDISLTWKVFGYYMNQKVDCEFEQLDTHIKGNETESITIGFTIKEKTLTNKKMRWLECNVIGYIGEQPLLHIPCLVPILPKEILDPNPISFFFPTLAISPDYDGNSDSNYFYFLSSYSTNGYQIDIWDEKESNRIGVLDYGQYENSAGYFQVPITGEVQGKTLLDDFYTVVPFLLKKGQTPDKKENWIRGKPAKLLIDRIKPTMDLEILYDASSNTIKATGQIKDNHAEFGLFLMYELDYDEADLIDVHSDGTFSCELKPESEYGFIAFTAQDIAGNTYRIKKRLE